MIEVFPTSEFAKDTMQNAAKSRLSLKYMYKRANPSFSWCQLSSPASTTLTSPGFETSWTCAAANLTLVNTKWDQSQMLNESKWCSMMQWCETYQPSTNFWEVRNSHASLKAISMHLCWVKGPVHPKQAFPLNLCLGKPSYRDWQRQLLDRSILKKRRSHSYACIILRMTMITLWLKDTISWNILGSTPFCLAIVWSAF